MKVTQLHELLNTVTQEVLGETAVVNDDLSNVVDIGKEIINTENVDNFVKKLVNQIGKVVFSNRLYKGGVPSVMMDKWEFGSILEKVTAELPTAQENKSWDLQDGENYSPDVFYQPKVSAKFFNSKTTFEVPLSFTERQVKQSLTSAEQLNGFISMLTTSVENAITIKIDSLVMRTINHMIVETMVNDLDSGKDGTLENLSSGSIKAVNLLKLFNANKTSTQQTTVEKALNNSEFIKFATYQMSLYSERMSRISTLFNIGGKEKFTPKELQHIVLLSDFAKASEMYLLADTRNAEKLVLPSHETVPFWQGSGENYSFGDVSKIMLKTASGVTASVGGVLGVIFDREALGVTNLDKRVTTNYNPKAEFYTNFYKVDVGFYNDFNENFVVFYIA